jgi:hypothetical protein
MSYKDSIKSAIHRYLEKQDKLSAGPTRKNAKPEKETEKQVLAWCKSQGWSVSIVESKAVFSPRAGRFVHGQAKAGFADIVGLTDQGVFVAIELKAKGRRSTLREAQRRYLVDVIGKHGFAVCVDSQENLSKTYLRWIEHPDKQLYLLSCLPLKPTPNEKPLFD